MDFVRLDVGSRDSDIIVLCSNLLYDGIYLGFTESAVTWRHDPNDLYGANTISNLRQFFEGIHTLVVVGAQTDHYSRCLQWCATPAFVPLPRVVSTLGVGYALSGCKHLGANCDTVTHD
jgi:hypothetical protein